MQPPFGHFTLTHLETVESAVVFKGEDMVGYGEEIPLGCNQTSNVHSLSCETDHSKQHGNIMTLQPHQTFMEAQTFQKMLIVVKRSQMYS